MMKIKKFIPVLVICGLSITAWLFNVHHYFSFDSFKMHQKYFEQFIEHNLILSMLIYAGIYVAVVALSMPVATFMTLAGGFLFGQWLGTGAVITSATMGACILFLSVRMASSDFRNKKAKSFAKKMQKGFKENALSYLFTLRLIPLFPFFAVNVAAALLQVPLKTFVIGTFFGIIPGSFIYVSMGVALRSVIQQSDFSPRIVLDPKILLAFTGLGILSLLPVLYKRLKKK